MPASSSLRRRNASRRNPNTASPPKSNKDETDNEYFQHSLCPSTFTLAFTIILAVRLLSAFYNNVADCDETFNYWEPTHYMLTGKGFQTWEYSPVYAIRSYAYILLHTAIGWFVSIFTSNKIVMFFSIRVVLGMVCAISETWFFVSVRDKFGRRVGFYCFLFLVASPGMFIASTSYLPSSFSMYGIMLCFGCWFRNQFGLAITFAAFSVILGWPFAIMVQVPLALHAIVRIGFMKTLFFAVASLLYFLVPSVLIDYYFTKKWIIAVLNIVLYNTTTSHGSTLFGVEPWTYYFYNGTLNFSLAFALAIISLVVVVVFRKWYKGTAKKEKGEKGIWMGVYLLPFYIWMALMLYLPHKEERFLFIVYPLIAFLASLTLVISSQIVQCLLFVTVPSSYKRNLPKYIRKFVVFIAILLFVFCSVSRIVALHKNYHAPLHAYTHLTEQELPLNVKYTRGEDINVCVGKEWYRFPSNFFLPTHHVNLQFLKSGFGGQLPKPFEAVNGTSVIPKDFNADNLEEPSRYVDVSICDYIVDLEFSEQREPLYSSSPYNFEVVKEWSFLDASNSPTLLRAFWIPYLSESKNKFLPYRLLRASSTKV